jgi:hypothetical protein
MQKVLSTKLESEEINRFEEMAQREGASKAGLLKRLALDYLDISRKSNMLIPACTSNASVSPKEDVAAHCKDSQSESLSRVPYEPQPTAPESTSLVDSSLPAHKDVDFLLKPTLLPTSREPVYHHIEPSSTVTVLKHPLDIRSSGIGWLIVGGLIVWGLYSESTRVVDPAAAPVRRKPIFVHYH